MAERYVTCYSSFNEGYKMVINKNTKIEMTITSSAHLLIIGVAENSIVGHVKDQTSTKKFNTV